MYCQHRLRLILTDCKLCLILFIVMTSEVLYHAYYLAKSHKRDKWKQRVFKTESKGESDRFLAHIHQLGSVSLGSYINSP